MEQTVASQFYNQWKPIITPIAATYGLNPDYLITQLGQESMWGTRIPQGSHNYAGIHEFRKGRDGVMARDAGNLRKFRTYENDEAFANDYARLMARLYPGTVNAASIDEFATALQNGKGGRKWAESPNYVKDLATVYNSSIANVANQQAGQPQVVESKWGVATPSTTAGGYASAPVVGGSGTKDMNVSNPFTKLYTTSTKLTTQSQSPAYQFESDDKWSFHTKPYKLWGL